MDVKQGQMHVNEYGAKIVRLIFHKFVTEGKGTHVIARELREEGIRPMRVKEWQNTVILRIIRNEKYCGDLVQKKTYTPDFLSHEKKYNRGQEEFVILKDHHEPIISRQLFDEANRILDAKSASQVGKAKHSNRYPFSGKLKCGRCGASYVARYKTRQDGSQYKAWRCFESQKNGSPHIDKAGNPVGCSGESIRNEDAVHIMYLVCQSLEINRKKIAHNLTRTIKAIISMDMSDVDPGVPVEKKQELMQDIQSAIHELIRGIEYEDEFYTQLLDRMVINDRENIDVYLNLLPYKWSYTVAKGINCLNGGTETPKKAYAPEWNISGASVGTEASEMLHINKWEDKHDSAGLWLHSFSTCERKGISRLQSAVTFRCISAYERYKGQQSTDCIDHVFKSNAPDPEDFSPSGQ
jgi:hypothetical protein